MGKPDENALEWLLEGRIKLINDELWRFYDGRFKDPWSIIPRKMTAHISRNGYARITLRDKEAKTRCIALHRLVWLNTNGLIPEGFEINHIDGNKLNNLLANLELVTHKQNQHHAIENGFCDNTNNKYGAKLNRSQIQEIRELYQTGYMTQKQLAKIYGISQGNITLIVNGITWMEV